MYKLNCYIIKELDDGTLERVVEAVKEFATPIERLIWMKEYNKNSCELNSKYFIRIADYL